MRTNKMPGTRRLGQDQDWFVLLPLEYGYARDILSGVSAYLESYPHIGLRVGDTTGLPKLIGQSPLISMLGAAHMAAAAASEAPVINVSAAFETSTVPQVVPDNFRAGVLAARHLLDLGYRRLAFIGGRAWFGRQRQAGFTAEAKRHGVSVVRGNVTSESRDMPLLEPPFGVFVEDDRHARQTIDILFKSGYHVPTDVGVLGCNNDMTFVGYRSPQLSSVDLNARKVGFEAARLLRQLLDGEPPPGEPILIEPAGVVARESTSVFAVSSPKLARAMEIISKRATQGLTVQDVADEVQLTRRQLLKLCRQHLGTTVKEQMRRVQLETAKALLEQTDRKITDVAEACGFNDYPRFNALFRDRVGVTPGQYRKARRLH